MPRKPTDQFWVDKVRFLSQNNPRLGAKGIERKLEEIGVQEGRTDWPSERVIRRIVATHRNSPEKERQGYEVFSWPDSMVKGALPWEAARVGLDLMRYFDETEQPERTKRPTVRVVKWAWRLRLASPSIPIDELAILARFLSTAEFMLSAGFTGDVQEVDWRLAYEPWNPDVHPGSLTTHRRPGPHFAAANLSAEPSSRGVDEEDRDD